jgi:hypothetical protein
MFGNKLLKYIDLIPLSNVTVGSRINDMTGNAESQLIERVKKSPYYALQIDETTDVTNYVNDDLMFCRTLPTGTTGEEIFHTLDSYVREERSSGKNLWASALMELSLLQADIVGCF